MKEVLLIYFKKRLPWPKASNFTMEARLSIDFRILGRTTFDG